VKGFSVSSSLQWQKSTFSGGGSGDDCVEVAATPTSIHVRESDAPATILSTTPTQLRALIAAIKAGSTN
jgi:hypothetical protein